MLAFFRLLKLKIFFLLQCVCMFVVAEVMPWKEYTERSMDDMSDEDDIYIRSGSISRMLSVNCNTQL